MEILLNIWWKSLHRNSRYCQNHQNGVTSCFTKMVINMKKIFFVVNHQNIGCKPLPKEEKNWDFETWPFTHYQTRTGILKHCVLGVYKTKLGYFSHASPLSSWFLSIYSWQLCSINLPSGLWLLAWFDIISVAKQFDKVL